MARFEQTYCSQCGGAFGPGEEGFSHCSTHRTLAAVKSDPRAATREIESSRFALRDALEALEVTAGNIRSLGPAGALPSPYTIWLSVVETAIEQVKAASPRDLRKAA